MRKSNIAKIVNLILLIFLGWNAKAEESTCYGTSSNGYVQNGIQLPKSGDNFSAYSSVGVLLGRNYVHSKVALTITDAYNQLKKLAPNKHYVYGESGWRNGGRIRPHRTHQNGTAVDFFVPVLNADKNSIPLPTSLANKFGYGIEFNENAQYDGLTIDFEAIAQHLYALDQAAKKNRITIGRVIFEKTYIPRLYKTSRAEFIKSSVPFMQGEPWIRHDEHYHVDFVVPCKSKQG